MNAELAWAAGFFEGEGCLTKHAQKGRSGKYVVLSVSQTKNTYTLERFIQAVGIGKVTGPYQTVYQISYFNRDAKLVLAKLFPYLSTSCVKYKKFEAMLLSGELT